MSPTVTTWCFVIFHLVVVFKCHLLAESLRKNKWLWTLAALVPLINLVPIWRILSKARKALRNQGIPATVFGASDETIKNLAEHVKARS